MPNPAEPMFFYFRRESEVIPSSGDIPEVTLVLQHCTFDDIPKIIAEGLADSTSATPLIKWVKPLDQQLDLAREHLNPRKFYHMKCALGLAR